MSIRLACHPQFDGKQWKTSIFQTFSNQNRIKMDKTLSEATAQALGDGSNLHRHQHLICNSSVHQWHSIVRASQGSLWHLQVRHLGLHLRPFCSWTGLLMSCSTEMWAHLLIPNIIWEALLEVGISREVCDLLIQELPSESDLAEEFGWFAMDLQNPRDSAQPPD